MPEPHAAPWGKNVLVEFDQGIAWVAGRDQGLKQFLDEKTYRPGLGHYERKR